MTPRVAVTTTDLAPLRETFGVARPERRRGAVATVLGAGAIAADIGLIATAAWLISTAAHHPNEATLAVAIVGVQFFGIVRGLCRYAERVVGHDAALRLLASLRVAVYRRLELLAPAGLPAFRRGDLLARVVQDVDSLQDLVVRVVPAFGIAAIVGTLTVVLQWWLLAAAGVVTAVALLIACTLVPWATAVLARRRAARFAAARGDLAAAMVDLVDGAAELVAFGAIDAQAAAVRAHDAELAAVARASAGTEGVSLAMTTVLTGLASWGCLVVGIPAVASGRLAATDLAVVTLVPLAAFELVTGLPIATQALHRVRQAAARVLEVTAAAPPVVDPVDPVALPDGPYGVALVSVHARYPGAHEPALRGVDLDLAPGRRVAIVGPSGSGKSTVAMVLLRFLAVEQGSATLGGVPLERLAQDDARTVIGLVGAETHLFHTTIAANLRVGRPAATDEELHGVLDRVGLAAWLRELPDGLATDVGADGARVSGGQRQRLALARAVLAEFDVLVLDEPAEHLEAQAADELLADLLGATGARSVVLLAHHVSSAAQLDGVYALGDGRLDAGRRATMATTTAAAPREGAPP